MLSVARSRTLTTITRFDRPSAPAPRNSSRSVTAADTISGHAGDDAKTHSSACPRSPERTALGRTPRRGGPQARPESSSRSPSEGSARGAPPVSHHLEDETRTALAPLRQTGEGDRAQLCSGMRARAVSPGALLHPARSRTSDRRGCGPARARLWNEIDRRARRASGEPRVRAAWSGPRRPLPPPHIANTERSAQCDRLCAPQRATAPREALPPALPRVRVRSRFFEPLVHRLGGTNDYRDRRPAGPSRCSANLAAERWLASPRPGGSVGDSGSRLIFFDLSNGSGGGAPGNPLLPTPRT
jgi:hypothetical protein